MAVDVVLAMGFWLLIGAPLIITTAAFLDAARRPDWAWAMSRRRRLLWMGALIGGGVTYAPGPVIAIFYWFTARRDLQAVERGEFDRFM